MSKTETKEMAAAKAGMDVKTARKYLSEGRLPSEKRPERNWRYDCAFRPQRAAIPARNNRAAHVRVGLDGAFSFSYFACSRPARS